MAKKATKKPSRKVARAEVLAKRAKLSEDPDQDALIAGFKNVDPVVADFFTRVLINEEATVYQDGTMTALALAEQKGRCGLAKEALAYILYVPEKETEAATSVHLQ